LGLHVYAGMARTVLMHVAMYIRSEMFKCMTAV